MVAAFCRHLGDLEVRAGEKLLRVLHTEKRDVVDIGHTGLLFDLSRQIIG